MDKNTITGFILIFLVFFGFYWYNQPTEEQLVAQQRYQDSIAQVKEVPQADVRNIAGQDLTTEFLKETTPVEKDTISNVSVTHAPIENQTITLENEELRVEFATLGGMPIKAELKNHKKFDGSPLYLFLPEQTSLDLTLTNNAGTTYNTANKAFVANLSNNNKQLTLKHFLEHDKYIEYTYRFDPRNPHLLVYKITITGLNQQLSRESSDYLQLHWHTKLPRQEKSESFEQRYSQIYYKYVGGDVEKLSDSKKETKEVSDAVKWISFKNQFFNTTLIANDKLTDATLHTTPLTSEDFLKEYDATFFAPTTIEGNSITAGFQLYLGTVDYSKLKALDANISSGGEKLQMDKLVPLGWALFRWVNQYFVIPLFNLLSSWGLTMGIIILLMTIIVKIILSPFTFKAFMSSAKMRVLRPQVMVINEKYPGNDKMMERQRATMELYGRAGVSPLGGCLPMLLQMPILLALFSFFPSAIELRQQSFLWATDLASYDAIIEWNTNIPLISTWFGNHISLFCLLMTITNVIYMKFSMDQQDTGQQQMPGMKMMMYLMPLMMLFFLNSYPSGLTYYYFVSTLITIILTLIFRYTVDEQKVLAKLEENKKKPRKKSGFMARLEEAQRIQQQRLREQQKKGNNRKRR